MLRLIQLQYPVDVFSLERLVLDLRMIQSDGSFLQIEGFIDSRGRR